MLTKTSLVILILSLNSVQSLFYNESEITRIVKNLNHYRGKIDTGNLPKLVTLKLILKLYYCS